MRTRTLCGVARKHFRAIGKRQQREAGLRFPCQHGCNDRRRGERIRIRTAIPHHALHTVLDEAPGNPEHQRRAQDFQALVCLRRGLLQDFRRREARNGNQRIPAVRRQLLCRRHRCLLHAPHRSDQMLPDLMRRQRSLIPDAHTPFLRHNRFHRRITAKLCLKLHALLTRKRRLQRKTTGPIHHMRHPLIMAKAHQSI